MKWTTSIRSATPVFAVAAALALLGGCASPDAIGSDSTTDDRLTPVKLDILPSVATVPVYVGVERGFFRDEGLEVEIGTGQGGAAILSAVVSGQSQFGFANNVSLMAAQERGLDVRIVANGSLEGDPADPPTRPQNVLVVKDDSGIMGATDLTGKMVAVNSLGNAVEVTTRAGIDAAGGDSSSINFVEMGMADMPAALEQGQVDAINIVEPFASGAIASGAVVIGAPFTDSMPDASASIANYFTSGTLAESDPGLVESFVAAMNTTLQYAQDHPAEMRAAVTEYMSIDADVVEQMTFPYWSPSLNVASIEALGELAMQYGQITAEPDYSRLLPECAFTPAADGGCALHID